MLLELDAHIPQKSSQLFNFASPIFESSRIE